MAAAATARKAAAPARAPRRRTAPARRRPVGPARRAGGQLIPLAVGTAGAVRALPDSGLVVRMTRGRLWIGVLGALLAGIVALNVITLSLAAEAGHVAQNIQALDEDSSVVRSRDAQKSGAGRVRYEAAAFGLGPAQTDVVSVRADPRDIATAAQRLAAAGAAY